jgi:hypothetical protein
MAFDSVFSCKRSPDKAFDAVTHRRAAIWTVTAFIHSRAAFTTGRHIHPLLFIFTTPDAK